MILDDIIAMWQEDVKIDETELSRESINTPKLHGKYLKHFSEQRLKLRSLKLKHKQLHQRLLDYYRVEVLEEIMKSLDTRGFVIKNSIDFLRFTNGS